METLTEQIRKIVVDSTVSTYAVAKQIGVSETLLGRFLKGERGLSVSSLDKLAEIYGIVAVQRIDNLPRPAKRGRKPKETAVITPTVLRNKLSLVWKTMAFESAKDANENNFPSRRGVYAITDCPSKSGTVLCLYNNNPWQDFEDGVSPRRERETEEFRKQMKKAGISELAYATYPPQGEESAGYTYAMLLDATEEQTSFVLDTMLTILADIRAEL